MAEILPLKDAIQRYVADGDCVALEGFTHLIPFAAGHEIIRQEIRDLYVIRMTPDIIYDQLIGMGCVRKMTFSWAGNPGVGSLHRFRDSVERSWPHRIETDERSHADVANAYVAGAARLPFGLFRGYGGNDIPQHNPNIKFVTCPFTGERLAASAAVRPKTTIIHAQQADRQGNVLLWGIVGVQKEIALAADQVIVTVEEIVDELKAPPNACVLPSWVVTAVACVPGGAHPSYAQDYYDRDNRFYQAWDAISRSREAFQAWMQRHVLDTRDFEEFKQVLARSTAESE